MAGRSPAIVVKAVKPHTATMIFAHGLGDSGAGWMSLASNWRQRGKFDHVKFIFPNAPPIPISVNFGMNMPAWYDIKGFGDEEEAGQDELGLTRSKEFFDTLIHTEVTMGIPSTRVVMGGFSQGAATALLVGLTTPRPLAGIVALSSYVPMGDKIPALSAEAETQGMGGPERSTPFFMGHGQADPLIKFAWGERSRDAIKSWGWSNVEFHGYPGLEHSADPQEIADLEAWLEKVLPDSPPQAGGQGGSGAGASASKA